MSTPEGSTFAQRLWARYTRYSTHAPHAQLARRIYRMHSDRLPLLTAVQRRWLPTEAAPFQSRLTLPYVQPSVLVDLHPPAMTPVQRHSDVAPISPRATGTDGVEAAIAPKPIVTVQRVRATSPGIPAASGLPLGPQVQRQASQHGAMTPVESVGRHMEASIPTPQQVRPARTVVPPLIPGAVQRSVATPMFSEKQRTPNLGVTIVNRHVGGTPGQIIYRTVVLPVQQIDSGPVRQTPTTAPSPVIQRQSDTGSSARHMPVPEEGVHPRIRIMRMTAPVASAARHSETVNSLPLATRGILPDVPRVPQAAASRGLGMTILQRHLGTSQSVIRQRNVGSEGTVSRGQSKPAVSPLMRQRLSPAATVSERASRWGPLSADVLPLARSGDAPSATSGFNRDPSLPLPSPNGHVPLPLVTPIANGQPVSVQLQTERQLTSNAMVSTPTIPPSASASPSTEAAATPADTNGVKADELAEMLWRKLMRRLAVESERRGRRAWP
jgi:hypothetical protein